MGTEISEDINQEYLLKHRKMSSIYIGYIPYASTALKHFKVNSMGEYSDVDKYIVYVEDVDEKTVVVSFQLPLNEDVEGGGAVEYRVSKETNTVLSVQGFE